MVLVMNSVAVLIMSRLCTPVLGHCGKWTQSTEHLQPRRNWPSWASNVFVTHPILRIGPVRWPPVPWTEKQMRERSPFFVQHGGHCYHGDLVVWTTFWIFFLVACKIWSNGLRSGVGLVGRLLYKSRVWSL
jgi:hypothetical protein